MVKLFRKGGEHSGALCLSDEQDDENEWKPEALVTRSASQGGGDPITRFQMRHLSDLICFKRLPF